MSQLPLFDRLDPQPLLWVDDGPAQSRPRGYQGQGQLFNSPALAENDLLVALETGAFGEARRLLRDSARDLTDSPYAREIAPLVEVLAEIERASSGTIAKTWTAMIGSLGRGLTLAAVNRGIVTILRASGELATVVAAHPALAAAAANALWTSNRTDAVLGRSLICDALVRGHEIAPDAVDDPIVRNLLAEDEPPRWLASLGVIRRVWHPHPWPPDQVDTWARSDADHSRADAASAFWECLCVERSTATKAVLEEGRRRMKRLRPAWHTAWLER